jgi:hypothetical protein
MSRQRKLGRPKKPGRKPGPIRWTLPPLAILKADLETALTALQAQEAPWQPTREGRRSKPKKISASALANWIKANPQSVCGKYPSADQLRQILTTYPVDKIALNDAFWKLLLEDDEK